MNVIISVIFSLFIHTACYSQPISKIKITDLNKLIKESDSVLIINFWATFCKPCVEEIPDLIRLSKKYKKEKVALYLVSLDLEDYYPQKIKRFVAKKICCQYCLAQRKQCRLLLPLNRYHLERCHTCHPIYK